MSNYVSISNPKMTKSFDSLSEGDMFRSMFPMNNMNVYMKIRVHASDSIAVLLITGNVYTFPCDKKVSPIDVECEVTIKAGS